MRRRLPLLLLSLAACQGGSAPPAPKPPPGAAATAPAPAPAGEPGLRLPAGVRPTREALDLSVDAAGETYTGTATIALDVDAPTDAIWLHGQGLRVEAVEVEGPDGPVGASWAAGAEGDKLALRLARPLGRGAALVRVRFEGRLDAEKSRGLYRVRERDGRWYAYSFFEPVDARRAFPCFDEPGFKIPWTVTLRVPPGDVALANTPLASEALEGGRRVFRFRESKPLPSYLVAFVAGPFAVVDAGRAGGHGTPLRFVLPRGRETELGYARRVTPKIVGLLEDYFEMPYPFDKLDVAVVPRFWGTMEHPGLVALGQPLTLIGPADETPLRRQFYANIAAHELGHYWFGDLVTAAWWDDIWLNEGLTTWLDHKITDRLDPSWRYSVERTSSLEASLESDALPSAKPLRQPVTSARAIEASFDAENTYFKGASVVGMIERWAGEAPFRRAVQRFLREHAWGSATSDDFLRAVAAEAGAPAADALRSFLDQPGAPAISAALRCNGTRATLALVQRRYRPGGFVEAAAPRGAKGAAWRVPVCFRYSTGRGTKSACHLLEGATAEVPLDVAGCPGWFVLNDGALGYYRSSYEPAMRARLSEQAAKVLDVPERVLFVGDVRAQVAAGEADFSAALELSAALAGEADRRVLAASSDPLRDVRVEFLPPPEQESYARLLQKLYGARARALGWLPKPGEGDDDALTRGWLVPWVALEGRDDALKAGARALADAWLAGRKRAPLDVVRPALVVAAHGGDAALFDRFVAAAESTDDRERRGALLSALGAFRDVALLDRAFELAAGGRFDAREARAIWLGAFERHWARDRAWKRLLPRLDAVFAASRDDEIAVLLGSVASFCDRGHYDELEGELGPRAARVGGGALALAKALERVGMCAAERRHNWYSIETFLRRY
jgi:aminopeptidase N